MVEGFAGQWLNVREFGSIMPAAEYRDNYDENLEQSSRLEAYAFFREVLSKDLPVTNFLDSDFVMLNERSGTPLRYRRRGRGTDSPSRD